MADGGFTPGTQLDGGRYRLEQELGRGGFGTVYLAQEVALERLVVIKVPHGLLLEQQGFADRFQAETRHLANLDHPNIVKIHSAGVEHGVPYAVVQFLAGGDLSQRIAKQGGTQTPGEVLDWMLGVAEALDFMHGQGVLHRDIKPDNILFDRFDRPYLSDFGISKALTDTEDASQIKTKTGMFIGSPAYVAPEYIDRDFTPACDQYSLAVVIYEALSDSRPHGGETTERLLVNKVTQPPEPLGPKLPSWPNAVSTVVMRALERAATERFSSCSEFAHALAEAASTTDEARTLTTELTGPGANARWGEEAQDAPRGLGGALPVKAKPEEMPAVGMSAKRGGFSWVALTIVALFFAVAIVWSQAPELLGPGSKAPPPIRENSAQLPAAESSVAARSRPLPHPPERQDLDGVFEGSAIATDSSHSLPGAEAGKLGEARPLPPAGSVAVDGVARDREAQDYFARAVRHEQAGNLRDAMSQYEKAIELAPNFGQPRNNLAYLLADSGKDLERALDLAQQAKKLLPDDPNVADTLGWVLYKRGIPTAAIGYLREAEAAADPSILASVRRHLALAYEANGEPAKAAAVRSRERSGVAGKLPGSDEATGITEETTRQLKELGYLQ